MDETNNLLPATEPPQPRRTTSGNRNLLIALVAAVLLGTVSVAAYVVMNTQASTGTGSPPDQAAQQFFTERNNGTPVVLTNTMSYGNSGKGGPPPGVIGTVDKVDGNTITVKNPMDGSTTTVQTDAATVVHKQADVKLSDITPGTTLTAIGTKKDGVLAADVIQIGKPDGPAGGEPLMSGPVQIQVRPGSDTTGTLIQPDHMEGTVDKVDGNMITLKTADGPATVQVSATTTLHQQVTADVSAIAAGDTVVAQGTQTGSVFAATSIDVSAGGLMTMQKP